MPVAEAWPVSLEVELEIESFLKEQSLTSTDIDLVIAGKNGDAGDDAIYGQLKENVFKDNALANYKHLSGEYPTSTAFALWLSASIIKTQSLPEILGATSPKKIKRILIYNHYNNIHHSLMLLSAC